MKIYRQGDVLLKQVRSIPKTAQPKRPKDRIVLAYGEATGHAHAIDELEKVDIFVKPDGTIYLDVKAEASLRHEEHGTVVLPPAKYERVLQREYSPEALRNVSD